MIKTEKQKLRNHVPQYVYSDRLLDILSEKMKKEDSNTATKETTKAKEKSESKGEGKPLLGEQMRQDKEREKQGNE